jgi:hypothetical protein
MVDGLGATVVGVGTLWNSGESNLAGHPVFGLLNAHYTAYSPDDCPLCTNGGPPIESVGY